MNYDNTINHSLSLNEFVTHSDFYNCSPDIIPIIAPLKMTMEAYQTLANVGVRNRYMGLILCRTAIDENNDSPNSLNQLEWFHDVKCNLPKGITKITDVFKWLETNFIICSRKTNEN